MSTSLRQRPDFDPRPVQWGFVVYRVPKDRFIPRVLGFSSVSIIPPTQRMHILYVWYRRCTISHLWAPLNNVVQNHPCVSCMFAPPFLLCFYLYFIIWALISSSLHFDVRFVFVFPSLYLFHLFIFVPAFVLSVLRYACKRFVITARTLLSFHLY